MKQHKKYQASEVKRLSIEGILSGIKDDGIYFETPDGDERLEFTELLEYFKDESIKVTIVMNKELVEDDKNNKS